MNQLEPTNTRTDLLLVEDDPAIARTVTFALEREGFVVTHASLLGQASAAMAAKQFSAVVLDVGLPDGTGLDWCRELRARGSQIAVLILSARTEELDRVLGLELGADDYLGKPFSVRELVARVRALLRRLPSAELRPGQKPDDISIDAIGFCASMHGKPLPLTRLEFLLLEKLIAARGRVLSRDALLNAVWHNEREVNERTVDTHVKTLRAKLRDIDASADPIITVRGVGYSLR